MDRRILLASPRGFCFGVERAVKMLGNTVKQEQGTIYLRKEIVHNTVLMAYYKSLGVVIADEVDDVPAGSVVVFSAHGVAPSIREKAKKRNLRVIDTTCPLVTKVHNEAVRLKEQGYSIILIGEIGHKEMIGVTGEAPENIRLIQYESDIDSISDVDSSRIAWLSQTTLNVDDTHKIAERLREKYPLLQDPSQECICYATKERQLAVKNIADECDLFIVVGSANSSNTKRLAEVAAEAGSRVVHRVDHSEELEIVDFTMTITVGITSGVSTTDEQLMKVIAYLGERGYTKIEERVAIIG
jgi:4-hydroxy-3-methylbut-2-enyl diphosphate reductase